MEPGAWREQSNNLLPPDLWGPRRHVGWLANSGQKWKKDQKVRKNIQKTAVKRKSPCNRGPRLVMSVEVNLAWLLCCEWTMDIVAVIWENGNREFKLVNLKSDSSGGKCIWPDYYCCCESGLVITMLWIDIVAVCADGLLLCNAGIAACALFTQMAFIVSHLDNTLLKMHFNLFLGPNQGQAAHKSVSQSENLLLCLWYLLDNLKSIYFKRKRKWKS